MHLRKYSTDLIKCFIIIIFRLWLLLHLKSLIAATPEKGLSQISIQLFEIAQNFKLCFVLLQKCSEIVLAVQMRLREGGGRLNRLLRGAVEHLFIFKKVDLIFNFDLEIVNIMSAR